MGIAGSVVSAQEALNIHTIFWRYTMYIIINRLTGAQVGGAHKTRKSACARRDKLDAQYGAYVHAVKGV